MFLVHHNSSTSNVSIIERIEIEITIGSGHGMTRTDGLYGTLAQDRAAITYTPTSTSPESAIITEEIVLHDGTAPEITRRM